MIEEHDGMGTFYANANFDLVRAAVAGAVVMVPDPYLVDLYHYQSEYIARAADAGLLIDVGHLPDSAVRTLGKRGAELAAEGAFWHPFGLRPWLLTHTWEGDEKTLLNEEMQMSGGTPGKTRHLYLVEPLDHERLGFRVTEYMLFGTPKYRTLAMTPGPRCSVIITSGEGFVTEVEGDRELCNAHSANSALTPVVTTLMLLNTRGVPTEERAAPKALNERNKRKGRPPVPGFMRVYSAEYVTAITITPAQRRRLDAERSEKRRSPIPHLRRGHLRHYTDGHSTWINDQLIGTKNEGELSWAERKRVGYRVST